MDLSRFVGLAVQDPGKRMKQPKGCKHVALTLLYKISVFLFTEGGEGGGGRGPSGAAAVM